MSDLTVPEGTPEAMELVSTGLPKRRDLVLNRPGNINYADARGSYPGCRYIEFSDYGTVTGLEPEDEAKFKMQTEAARQGNQALTAVEGLNLYLKHRANLLTIKLDTLSNGRIRMLYTNQLEDDELENFHETSRFIHQHMEEFKAKKAEQRQAAEAAEAARRKDLAELAELGKKERDGNFIKRARDAEEKVAKLEKENTRLRRKIGKED